MSKTFRIKLDALSNLGNKAGRAVRDYDIAMETRTKAATDIVWRTAHAKRPMISVSQAKQEAKWNPYVFKIKGTNKYKRVSDPDASLGVPVDTGALQASITQTVERTREGFRGIVSTAGIPYAAKMEFGDSKTRARPFMRPAVNLNKEVIKRVFGMSVIHNL